MMADVEPIPWQMLLPMFNSVADVGTTYWLIISQILDFYGRCYCHCGRW